MAFGLSGKDIMAPSVMMSIMFFVSTIFTLLNVDKWNIDYSLDACMLISSGILVFILAETAFRYYFCGQLRGYKTVHENYDVVAYNVKTWKLVIILLFDFVVCLLYLRSIMSMVGGNLTNLSSYFVAYRRLGISSLKNGDSSGVGGYLHPLLWIVSASGYISIYVFVNNWIAKYKIKYKQILMLLILIASGLPDIMAGGRSGALRLASAFFITYYILWHQKNGWTRNLSWRYIRVGSMSLMVGIPAFYYSLGLLGRTTDKSLGDYASLYLGASIEMLNQYIKAPVERAAWGEESLVSVKKILSHIGIGEMSHSYNLEFRALGAGHSNIYTFFRRPLHDFGFIGMYIFVIFVASFFAWLYFKKIKYRTRKKTIPWVLLYGYLYYWLVCSSMDQYSQNYISAGTVIVVTLIIAGFHFVTDGTLKTKITFKI